MRALHYEPDSKPYPKPRDIMPLIDDQIKGVLHETACILLPLFPQPDSLIAEHIWRDRGYVGEAGGKVVAWRGWRAKLADVDSRYRTLYIDVVDNILPDEERERLFGDAFASAIAGMDRFVVMFALDFPLEAEEAIEEAGFVPRRLSRVLHACIIAGPEQFLSQPALMWATMTARLLVLQSQLSKRSHR